MDFSATLESQDNVSSEDWKKAYFEHLLASESTSASSLKHAALNRAKCLYRYRPFSKNGLQELVTGRVYLAKPDELNDPYECKLLINNTGKYPFKLGSAYGALHHFEKRTHIAAFCEDPKLLTMWAHYANRPKGCCLEFAADDLTKDQQIERALHPVIYSSALFDANELLQGAPETLRGILLRSACHKLKSWSYEREWRLINLKLNTPAEKAWPGDIPLSDWAPNFKIEDQSQPLGFDENGHQFIELPKPRRIIFLGDKLDPDLRRLVHGISRLADVQLALAEFTPDAQYGAELEIKNVD